MDVAVEAQLWAALGDALGHAEPAPAWRAALDAFIAVGLIDEGAADRWAHRIDIDHSRPSEPMRERALAYAARLVAADRDDDDDDWLDREDEVADELVALRAVGLISEAEEVELLDRLAGAHVDDEDTPGDLRAVVAAPPGNAAGVTVIELWTRAVIVRQVGMRPGAMPRLTDDRGTDYEMIAGGGGGSSRSWMFAGPARADAATLTCTAGGAATEVAIRP